MERTDESAQNKILEKFLKRSPKYYEKLLHLNLRNRRSFFFQNFLTIFKNTIFRIFFRNFSTVFVAWLSNWQMVQTCLSFVCWENLFGILFEIFFAIMVPVTFNLPDAISNTLKNICGFRLIRKCTVFALLFILWQFRFYSRTAPVKFFQLTLRGGASSTKNYSSFRRKFNRLTSLTV